MRAEVVIAVRGGPQAKTRLAERLDALRREALVEAMLADMLSALGDCQQIRRVHVSTPTPTLARLAARFGAVVILEREAGGLNGAFDRVRRRIAAAEPNALVALLPGDLPRLRPADAEALLSAAEGGRIAVAPASADGGTGGLALRAGAPLRLAFGPGSFGKHLAAARSSGSPAAIVRAPGLAFDLDRPADLDALLALGGGPSSTALLQGWSAAA